MSDNDFLKRMQVESELRSALSEIDHLKAEVARLRDENKFLGEARTSWQASSMEAQQKLYKMRQRVEKAEAELAAERERRVVADLDFQRVSESVRLKSEQLRAICRAAELLMDGDPALRPVEWASLRCRMAEALRPAAPEECPACSKQPDPTPSEGPTVGVPAADSEQPDLPLGHEFVPIRYAEDGLPKSEFLAGCAKCGQPESTHRRREP